MREYFLNVSELREFAPKLIAGDKIFLSGTVYTARDAAHKRIFELIENDKPLPFSLSDAVIYYAGPTPTPDNAIIGSCGPTTSVRMDFFAPKLYDMGIVATIGKGQRNKNVTDAIIRNNALYLCAIGGAGALASRSITQSCVVAFDDLGCESVKMLEFDNFPLYVGIDCEGNTIFKTI